MEAVLDFGRGCQNLAIILFGGVGEGGGRKWGAGKLPPLSHLDGERGVTLQLCALHIYVVLFPVPLFLFLRSAVEASFDIKKACEKPYNHYSLQKKHIVIRDRSKGRERNPPPCSHHLGQVV
jgi:hypothetical protein